MRKWEQYNAKCKKEKTTGNAKCKNGKMQNVKQN